MIDVETIIVVHGTGYRVVKDTVLRAFCATYTKTLLAQAGGNKSKAARLAGIDRSAWRRLERKATS